MGEGEDRVRQMADRVVREAEYEGVDADGVSLLSTSVDAALAYRVGRLDDDRNPTCLHPGRTALILLQDLGRTEAPLLAAAALVESEYPELRVPSDRIAAFGEEVAALVRAVPLGAEEGERLLEALVGADPEVRVVALAERLDHLRHAHLWPDLPARRRVHAEATAVYLPVAERTDATLARRYRWWCGMFARRWLSGPSTS